MSRGRFPASQLEVRPVNDCLPLEGARSREKFSMKSFQSTRGQQKSLRHSHKQAHNHSTAIKRFMSFFLLTHSLSLTPFSAGLNLNYNW
jgi:hypothetical protein